MRFVKADIYGFGKWVDQTFDFSSAQFNAFYGENESGKSTLQQFFLFVMFGLPPKRRQHFESKYSSRFGGSLTVEQNSALYTIERTKNGVRVLTEDGEAPAQFLEELLYGLTRETFESIYAFTALQLSEIQQMKVQDLNDVLFSVGLTGSTSIYKVEKTLDQRLGSLYKARGWKAEINEQLKKVETLAEEVRQLQHRESTYIEKRTNLEELKETLEQLEMEQDQIEATLHLKEKHLYACKQKEAYLLLEKERAAYEEIKPFPEEGIARFERLKDRLLPIESERNVLKQQLQQYEKAYEEANETLLSKDYHALLQQFMKQKMIYIDLEKDIAHLTVQLKQIEETLREKLSEVSLTVEEIEDIILPFHLDQTVQQIKEQASTLQQEEAILQDEKRTNQTEINRLEKEIDDINDQIIDETLLEERKTANKRYENEQLFYTQHASRQRDMEAFTEKKRIQSNQIMYGAIVVAIICAFIGWSNDMPMFMLFAGILVIIGVAQKLYLQRLWDAVPISTQHATDKMTEQQYIENEQIIQQQQTIHQELFLLQNELKKVLHADLLLDNKWEAWKTKQTQLQDKIATVTFQYPFLQQLEVYIWDTYIRYIREVKEMLQTRSELQNDLYSMEHTFAPLERIRKQLGEHLGVPNVTIQQIEEIYEQEQQSVAKKEQAEREMNERQNVLIDIEEKIATYRTEMKELFAIAQVENDNEFYTIARENEKITSLDREMKEILSPLQLQFSEVELKEMFASTESEETLEELVEQLRQEKIRKQTKMNGTHEQYVAVQYEVEQLEASGILSEKIYLLEMEKTKLTKLTNEWSVYKVAQAALDEAKKRYQEKYFHAVIDKTSTFFEHITQGKYVTVFAPTEKLSFQVETEDQRRYRVDELSKGTIDQLYVALRLAMNVIMQEKISVPLIIDDAFVHFDTVRSSQMVQLLREISVTQQVILFTCKDYFAKQVQATHILTNEKMKEDVHA